MEKAKQKVGGKFKLITLIQKRMRELIKSGLTKGKDSFEFGNLTDKILDEILEGQIYFEEPDKAKK